MLRIGHGYDVHRLQEGRKLILGGVVIPYTMGLEGHSDADVLTHAVMDALLGAAACGDIGKLFPDTEEKYRGISSLVLLENVKDCIEEKGYRVSNVDCTIIAQKPRLAAYIPNMRQRLAKTLDTETENINIKATTEEGLGFTGQGEGIAAHCVALIYSDK
jgi:2-C-methyl-D-erythritol 2,4-cyclodiphosphate synthase